MKNLRNEEVLEVQERLSLIIKLVTTGKGEELRSHTILTKQENLVAVPRLAHYFYFPKNIREGFLKAAQSYKLLR